VALYAVARLWRAAAICLDGDEIFSIGLARMSWAPLTHAALVDSVHPPLFYYLLKLWVGIGGDSLLWLRLLPCLFSVLSIVPILLLCRALRLRRAELYSFLGWTALNPFLIYYSQHLRMYTLLLLCGLTSLWLFHRLLQADAAAFRSRLIALTAANIVMVYAHYYGWLLLGLECAYLLLWKPRRILHLAGSCVVVLAASSPWLYAAVQAARAKGGLGSNLEWIQKPDLNELKWFFIDLAGFSETQDVSHRAVMSILLVTVAAVVFERRRLLGPFGRKYAFLAFFAALPSAISFTASNLMAHSIWGHRHLLFVAIPLMMIATIAFYRLPFRSVRILGALLAAAWIFLVGQHQLRGDDKKTPTDSLVLQMLAREDAGGHVPFFAVDKYLHYPVWFYLENLKAGKTTGFAVPIRSADLPALGAKAARIDVRPNVTMNDVQGSHFWVGYSSYSWKEPQTPDQILQKRGCRTGADIVVSDRFHRVTAFPAWCPSGGSQ
jgi:hypothetical protein